MFNNSTFESENAIIGEYGRREGPAPQSGSNAGSPYSPGDSSCASVSAQSCEPLGNTTKFVDKTKLGELNRYFLQSVIAEILPTYRVAWCHHHVLPGREFVDIYYSAERKRASYGGLMVCGMRWVCPVCAAKITEKRRREVSSGLENWQGGSFMIAYTLQHTRENKLTDLRVILNDSFRKMQQSRSWRNLKAVYGVVGQISSQEITWGENGWHPHKHALMLTERKVFQDDLLEIEEIISYEFRQQIWKNGGYSHPEYGVKLSIGDTKQMGDYVGKGEWGTPEELTKSGFKHGRKDNLSPFELALWASSGDAYPIYLFREYAESMKGVKQLVYSRGLRSRLNMEIEKDDVELSQDHNEESLLLAQIGRDIWQAVCKKGLRSDLLEVSSSGSVEKIGQFLLDVLYGRLQK